MRVLKSAKLLPLILSNRANTSLRSTHAKMFMLMCSLFFTMSWYSSAVADELVRDERRLWANGSPQEIWTYGGTISPDNLVRKELFYESGAKRRQENFVGGVQHGITTAWFEEGSKKIEEAWADGGKHGFIQHWPNPRDSEVRKKQLKPTLQATWENGVPSGLWQEWVGWGDDRWLRIQKSYAGGELDGLETIWRNADSMERKHSYSQGKLDGRQFAWDYNGSMVYQYQFIDGLPDGFQRKYENDLILQELFFVDGKLHGSMTWEDWLKKLGANWDNGLRSDTKTWEDGTTKRVQRFSFVPSKQFDGSGFVQFQGDVELFDDTIYDELGQKKLLKVVGPPRTFTLYWPNGDIRRIGKDQPGSPDGSVQEYYEDGSLFREEKYLKGKRLGIWTIRDPSGRVVSQQTWDYYLKGHIVTEWHSEEIKASEGSVEHSTGNLSGRKMGEWKYWTADGRLLRTETYGAGPYSGNRAFIYQMTQWDSESRIEFEGSEKELFFFKYDEENPARIRSRQTVKLLDRTRGQLESWDSESLQIVRRNVNKPTELDDTAQVINVLGGRGVVLVDERFYSDGTPETIERFDSNGTRNGVQEGWYQNGIRAYEFFYLRGSIQSAKEWWSDGTLRLEADLMRKKELVYFTSLMVRDLKGRQWQYENQDQRWKAPGVLLDKCHLWQFDETISRP